MSRPFWRTFSCPASYFRKRGPQCIPDSWPKTTMGIGTSALLGSTNKFFMPWLIPRNDRNSIFQANFFGKLAGRTKRNNDRIDVPIQADARYGNENYGGYSGKLFLTHMIFFPRFWLCILQFLTSKKYWPDGFLASAAKVQISYEP